MDPGWRLVAMEVLFTSGIQRMGGRSWCYKHTRSPVGFCERGNSCLDIELQSLLVASIDFSPVGGLFATGGDADEAKICKSLFGSSID